MSPTEKRSASARRDDRRHPEPLELVAPTSLVQALEIAGREATFADCLPAGLGEPSVL